MTLCNNLHSSARTEHQWGGKVTGGDFHWATWTCHSGEKEKSQIISETLRLLCLLYQVFCQHLCGDINTRGCVTSGASVKPLFHFWINNWLQTEVATQLQQNNSKHFPNKHFDHSAELVRLSVAPKTTENKPKSHHQAQLWVRQHVTWSRLRNDLDLPDHFYLDFFFSPKFQSILILFSRLNLLEKCFFSFPLNFINNLHSFHH